MAPNGPGSCSVRQSLQPVAFSQQGSATKALAEPVVKKGSVKEDSRREAELETKVGAGQWADTDARAL